MPRELTHYFVASEALLRAGLSPAYLRNPVFRAALFMGSCLHDSGYYHLLPFPQGEDFSSYLHGMSPDGGIPEGPYEVALHLWQHREMTSEFSTTLACMFGLIAHSITDAICHPLIHFLSGNYDDADTTRRRHSRARHRFIEAVLEDEILDEHPQLLEYLYLRTHLRFLRKDIKLFSCLQTFADKKGLNVSLEQLIVRHAWFQSFFVARWTQYFCRCLPIEYRAMRRRCNRNLFHLTGTPYPSHLIATSFLTPTSDEISLKSLLQASIKTITPLYEDLLHDMTSKQLPSSCEILRINLDTGNQMSCPYSGPFAPQEEWLDFI